eukprot:evm.model.scf_519EXC.3 EVM.evm.TU.scf_519EXC.3   scf_519EXC:16336-18218(+)
MDGAATTISGAISTTANALRDAFVEGRFSDITVDVKNTKFRLHRVVLWQIPYFRSLFQGNWKDSDQDLLRLDAADPLVTAEAFQAVVRTVYHLPMALTLQNVLSIHAAGSFLQMEELCVKCVDFISDHLSVDNVVSFTLIADAYEYMARKRLAEACKRFLLVHATDLRDQLSKLTVASLRDLFASDSLWVPSEYDRFTLIMDAFAPKLEAAGKKSRAKAAPGVGGGDQWGPDGAWRWASLPHAQILSAGYDDFPRESEDSVRRALESILATSLHFEYLSLEDGRAACARCAELKMCGAMEALLVGRFKAEALQATIQSQGAAAAVRAPAQGEDPPQPFDKDLGTFRFGVELADAKGLRPDGYWASGRVFFGGSEWWLVVQRRQRKNYTGHPYGVFLYRESADTERRLYSDRRSQLAVEVEFLCAGRRHPDKRRKFRNWDYCADWGFWQFLVEDELDMYLTAKDSLRFGVLVRLAFGSSPSGAGYAQDG